MPVYSAWLADVQAAKEMGNKHNGGAFHGPSLQNRMC